MHYIYETTKGWAKGDQTVSPDGFEKDAVSLGYKLSARMYTNFFTVSVHEGPGSSVKFPWVLVVKSNFNSFVIQTATLPDFLDCCAKLLINDVSA